MDRLEEAVVAAVDEEACARMTVDLVNIPSPPGDEQAVGDYLASRFAELGMAIQLQEVEARRNNVVATLAGEGGGEVLLFSGHQDTSTTGDEESRGPGHQAQARREGDWINGLGASNMKAAFAAYYQAIRALRQADVRLNGDVLMAAVVGETERAAVDRYQGAFHRGGGVGSRHLVTHGLAADHAIIGEPTGLRITLGNTGWIHAKITTHGVMQTTWCKEAGVDPFPQMLRVIQAIYDWEPEFKRRHPHPLMEARLGVSAIEGGYPFKPGKCPPPSLTLYVDLRIPPPFTTMQIKRELDAVLAPLRAEQPEVPITSEFYFSSQGYEIAASEAVPQAVEAAHALVFGVPAPYATPNRYAVSSDGIAFSQYHIPTITYGPGGVMPSGDFQMYGAGGELVSARNIAQCARVYALAAMRLCGVAE